MSTGSAALSKLTLNPPKFLLLTIPLPNSGPARELRRILECNVPCALEIVHSSSATDPALREGRRIVPRKYLGAVTLGEPIGWEHPGVKH